MNFVNPAGKKPVESVITITELILPNSVVALLITGNQDRVTLNVEYYETKDNSRGNLLGKVSDVSVNLKDVKGILGLLITVSRDEKEKKLAEVVSENSF